ncbi:VOC family protein [Thermoactinospora rubra]|uniref:VOC family protein n=1 Tax=Thermoactinospora rubra TaxID=1088767 RepID=UPI000A0FFEE9|nr:VOC family protein [Thermoactinospora rubra]
MNRISGIVIDCANPAELATFYQKALGGDISGDDPGFATLSGGPVGLSFQRVPGYQPPAWPHGTKQVHLDLAVDNLDTAVKELLALGATRPAEQPGGDDWVVLRDPEGHLFCVMEG